MPGTTPKTVQEDEMAKAKILVNTLKEKGITLLAIDFDRTIVSVHTAGAWRRGAETLAEYVRPCFKAALKAALAETLIHVCVVTYSQQPELIREVLKHALPHSDISKVMIRASTRDWVKELPPVAGLTNLGKEQHIASVVTELYNRYHLMVKPGEILLFDDDLENVKIAVEFGHKGFEIKEDVSLDSLLRYAKNC